VRKLLGPSRDALLGEGGRMEIDIDSQIRLDALLSEEWVMA
jgi:hypothetical protein